MKDIDNKIRTETYRGARNGLSLPPKRSCPDSFLPPRPPPIGENKVSQMDQ